MAVERIRSKMLKFYAPLVLYLVFLLFPFYWMVNTTFKSDNELYDLSLNPFVIHSPTLENLQRLFTETIFLRWMANTFFVAITATLISLLASLLAAYAIQRLRFRTSGPTGVAIFLGYLVPQTILFIPLAHIIFKVRLWDSLWALVLTYPTFLIPFCTWLLMGYFKSIPKEMEECAMVRPATSPAPSPS
jgi:multiple sugar transport system permease protein